MWKSDFMQRPKRSKLFKLFSFQIIRQKIALFFLAIFLTPISIFGSNICTLIVTYQSDSPHISLDRVRFWLIDEHERRSLFPRPDQILSNQKLNDEQTVVISDIPAGDYRIQFLVPNKRHQFATPQIRQVTLTAGTVTRVNEKVGLKDEQAKLINLQSVAQKNSFSNSPVSIEGMVKNLPPYSLPLPSKSDTLKGSQVNIEINKDSSWKLMRQGKVVFQGVGSTDGVSIAPGNGYYLIYEDIVNHHVQMTPKNPFDLVPGKTLCIVVKYLPDTGTFDLKGAVENKYRKLFISLRDHSKKEILDKPLQVIENQIHWQSPPIAIGSYELKVFGTEKDSTKKNIIFEQALVLEKNHNTSLSIDKNKAVEAVEDLGGLKVTSNINEAIYTLQSSAGLTVAQGHGCIHEFKKIVPDTYILKFSSADPRIYLSPEDKEVLVSASETSFTEAKFGLRGRLTLGSNLQDGFVVKIEQLNHIGNIIEKKIENRSEAFYLPEGPYKITYKSADTAQDAAIHKLYIGARSPQTLYHNYEIDSADRVESLEVKKEQTGAAISTNNSGATIVIEELNQKETPQTPILKEYQGKRIFIKLKPDTNYRLSFLPLPNHETPATIILKLKKGEVKNIKVEFKPTEEFVLIPAGKAIIGDPFSTNIKNLRPAKEIYLDSFYISKYPVTNSQFSNWLNVALKMQKIKFSPTDEGVILNERGNLVCKTQAANPLSQIICEPVNGSFYFYPQEGKENHPVIEVSWYGADLYCKDHGGRLLTENEWEKAAGMSTDLSTRYKYGCMKDHLDETSANFRRYEVPLGQLQVNTTAVGFYNGRNALTSKLAKLGKLKTNDSKSPFGLYDMTGNVWEWVSNYDDENLWIDKKIVKGGSYDSPKKKIKVACRHALAPEHADIYTGFRMGKSVQ